MFEQNIERENKDTEKGRRKGSNPMEKLLLLFCLKKYADIMLLL